MAPGARGLRTAIAALLAAALAAAAGGDAFWLCLPAALALAAAEPTPRAGAGGAGAVLAATAIGAPAPAPVLGSALCLGVVLAFRSRLERERDAMRRFALRDPLTGVANRRALDERLHYEVARHTRHSERFAVLVMDLDGFKAVNDRFGHDAGDELLRYAAAALVAAVRDQDTVVRLGGDEFCVLAPQTDAAGAERLRDRILDALAGVTAGVHGLSASVGAAVFPDHGRRADVLLATADAAALEVKRRSRAARPLRRAA